ncbi:MAG TPA: aminotransferase class I/II-fold pyridoxal phosphate-dependent enzyme [Solirubrobacteraceae bacterium]|jgi:histidinol-phosphate aminotransferase
MTIAVNVQPSRRRKAIPFLAPETLERSLGHKFELRLGANENPFGPSPRAIEAGIEEFSRLAWYADPESHRLRRHLARTIGVQENHLIFGNGIDDLLDVATRHLLDANGVAIATAGTYPMFAYYVSLHGGRLVTVPYSSAIAVDLARLEQQAVRFNASVVYVANPDNPSGAYIEPDRIEAFAASLPASCILLLDEAYVDFSSGSGAEHIPSVTPSRLSKVVRLRTFSKAHGLAGLRIGYAIAHEQHIEYLERSHKYSGVNRIAQAAASAALEDHGHLAAVVSQTIAERPYFAEVGKSLGWTALPSNASFVTFDVGDRTTALEWVDAFARCGVFIRRCRVPPLESCVRITVGTQAERRRLEQIVAGIGKSVGVHDVENACFDLLDSHR